MHGAPPQAGPDPATMQADSAILPPRMRDRCRLTHLRRPCMAQSRCDTRQRCHSSCSSPNSVKSPDYAIAHLHKPSTWWITCHVADCYATHCNTRWQDEGTGARLERRGVRRRVSASDGLVRCAERHSQMPRCASMSFILQFPTTASRPTQLCRHASRNLVAANHTLVWFKVLCRHT